MKYFWLIGFATIGMAGCAPVDKTAVPTGQPPAQSNATERPVARQAVEGFTGKTAVDSGERTKAKIKDINAQRRQNFEEIPP